MFKVKLSFSMKYVLIFTVFLNLAVCQGTFALEERPLFELEVGDNSMDSGKRVGMWVDEAKIVSYDKFYFPASFAVYKDLDLVIILDSIRGRLCKFSLRGKYLGEVKLPFRYHAIDFTYFPQAEKIFLIFQDAPVLGVLDIDLANSVRIRTHEVINIENILGVNLETNIQNVWPCYTSSRYECIFILNIGDETVPSAAFSYREGRLSYVGNIGRDIVDPIGMVSEAAVVGFSPESDLDVVIEGLTGDVEESLKLPQELTPYYVDLSQESTEHSEFISDVKGVLGLKEKRIDKSDCLFVRLAGTDNRGNIYVEGYYGPSEDTIKKAYLYKLDRYGFILGKTEIPTSPRMLVNRFIFVDPNGYVFYMQKDAKDRKIKLYQFNIF